MMTLGWNWLDGVKVFAAVVALSHAFVANAGAASASLTVSAVVLPRRAQVLKDSQISVRQRDGTSLILNAQQQMQYIKEPASITKLVRGSPMGDVVVVTVEY